jgi:PKHD-type hydroxylase
MSGVKKSENTAWSFKVDTVNAYAYWEKAFTPEECNKIIKIGKDKGLIKGGIIGKSKLDIRSSQITWLVPDDLEWVYRKITDIVLSLNDRFFQFDIYGIIEQLQFTNYKAPSDNYGKHVDKAQNFPIRKLSVSIQLTDPKKYKGGELYLYDNEQGVEMKKEQGDLILFPSYTLHEVKPVTKGERNSLVAWVTGKQFK